MTQEELFKKLVAHCKEYGFVFPSSEIYDGLGAVYDYGQNGVERDFYEAVAPTGCFWCTPRWLWENDAGKGYNTHGWKTIIVRGWMEELGVRENYVMMNGVQELDL